MKPPLLPPNESERLQALHERAILDTPSEERFDRLTRLAQALLKVPIALVSLVDAERQWFKSRQGLDACETGRDISFCGHAILEPAIFEICDARLDPRFADNPLVTGAPHIRFYAGAPLSTSKGHRIGTLCIIADQPRQLNDQERQALRDLADCVQHEINQVAFEQQRDELARAQKIIAAVSRAQSKFLAEMTQGLAFDSMLEDVLELTESKLGFIAEVLRSLKGEPYLKIGAISKVLWNDAMRGPFELTAPRGMELHNLQTLFGAALTSGKPVIANDAKNDVRSGGLPEGHPVLDAFLGIPVQYGNDLVAMVGLANRPEGYAEDVVEYLRPWIATLGQLVVAARNNATLVESEARLNEAQRIAKVGSWELNLASGKLFWTDEIFNLFEIDKEQFGATYEAFLNAIHPDDRDIVNTAYTQSLSNRTPYTIIHRLQMRDGRIKWVEERCTSDFDEEGKPLISRGSVQDITERREREQQLWFQEEQFAAVFNNSAEQIMLLQPRADAELEILAINRAYENTWAKHGLSITNAEAQGLTRRELLTARTSYTQQQCDQEVAMVRDVIASRVPRHIEYTVPAPGRTGYVETTITPIFDGTGACQLVLWQARDVSERKWAEIAVREQVEYTQAILDNIVDGIVSINAQGTITSFNPAAERIFGYCSDEVIGRNVSMLMSKKLRDTQDGTSQDYQKFAVAQAIGARRLELEGVRRDGSLFYMELATSNLTHQGVPIHVVTVRDVTERVRVDRMKGEFVSTVSHELRTPLTSIAGALGLVVGGALGEVSAEAATMIGIAHKNSLRLTHLINDLLDMEKISAGKMHFDMQRQPLMALIEQAIETNRAYGFDQGVTLKLTQDAPDVEVCVDGQRVLQVLSNLLSNAIKFSPRDGVVEVWVHRAQKVVRVSVRDYGPGIPASFRERIFQKFAQADSSDTRSKGGTGLGLAITRELVERMGGHINFESEEGAGTRFFFELPCVEPPTDNFAVVNTGPSSALRILVVEDEPEVASLLETTLTNAGYAVDTAMTGSAAQQALQSGVYAAMTLDLLLPDINGLELIRWTRLAPATAELPIIVVSARVEDGRLALHGDLSGICWLPKPLDEACVLSTLERMMPAGSSRRLRVLHVENDADLHEVVRAMAGERFDFELATTLHDARARLSQTRFELVLLDIDLPDGSGLELLSDIRARQSNIQVVVLTGAEMMADEAHRVDAVLRKSKVSTPELIAAISSRLHFPGIEESVC